MVIDSSIVSEIELHGAEVESEIIKIRRTIHENPELAYHEIETASIVEEKLKTLGFEVRTKVGGTGVVGVLRGKHPGKTVALRADMDALPIAENTDEPFKSKKPGIMHACGHDTHVAMLLGAAMILAKMKEKLHGTVKLIFQPAEEDGGRGGAKPMIEDGALENPKPDYFFGIHISSDYPSGVLGVHGGPFMARPDAFKILIKGRGGHGSQPWKSVDPIFVGSQVVNSVYAMRSRLFDQRQPLTISFCMFHSGTKDNIIPDEASLEGTIRTLDEQFRNIVIEKFSETVSNMAKSYGADVTIKFTDDPYPVTVNNAKVAETLARNLALISGVKIFDPEPRMGAEDVSRFLQKVPGCFYYLGTYNEKKGCTAPNHSSRFKVDESVLKTGSIAHAISVFSFTQEH
ncbi:amidohydrolase [Thermoplasmatales archaeon AK]|nr:amidohydrolase [Thermoplasmatales archaeon AK]